MWLFGTPVINNDILAHALLLTIVLLVYTELSFIQDLNIVVNQVIIVVNQYV